MYVINPLEKVLFFFLFYFVPPSQLIPSERIQEVKRLFTSIPVFVRMFTHSPPVRVAIVHLQGKERNYANVKENTTYYPELESKNMNDKKRKGEGRRKK